MAFKDYIDGDGLPGIFSTATEFSHNANWNRVDEFVITGRLII